MTFTNDDTCPVCGLSRDLGLCVCESMAQQEQKVTVKLERRKWGRIYSIIRFENPGEIDISDLATKLKSKLACGGSAKNKQIELQGDHSLVLEDLLTGLGFPRDNLEVNYEVPQRKRARN
ncbi:MAG: stress response translation initiation inhibitor YciH [Candidatus Heimdallarchaeota archaeon]|nr:stress response translation initiation inhibitor YciH [Candidatus Heimdallarchaeota archaeon]MCK5049108.1 stress response translation initiation inhibitor YciH [Candidatus Heimdallarchaeota archaeon]